MKHATRRKKRQKSLFKSGLRREKNLDSCFLQILQQIARFFESRHHEAYLVGGAVRNLLLQEPEKDWDIMTDSHAHQLARELAHQLGGHYVRMHEKASRVVLKHVEGETVFDIAPLHGETLESDLRLRDFTINAMAVPLTDVVRSFEIGVTLPLIDPLHGLADLKARRLRAVDDAVFRHDPLRLLRAVRFLQRYDLTLDSETAALMKRDATLLPAVAVERIHDEIYALLQPAGATRWLHMLDEHGLLTVLMPEFIPARAMRQPGLHHWDVFEHSLETVTALEQVALLMQSTGERELPRVESEIVEAAVQEHVAEIRVLLEEAEQQGIFSFSTLMTPVLKLAVLLHDIGKTVTQTIDEEGNIHFYGHPQAGVPLAQAIMKRLGASTQDRRLVQQVVANHMRPGQLSRGEVTQRAARRFFVDLGPIGIYVVLISLADHLAMRGPDPLTVAWEHHLTTVRLLLTRYVRERERLLPPRLVQAEELMQYFHLAPGPLLGQLLDAIAEAQMEGRVRSKAEGLWLAEERLNQMMQ